MTNYEQTQLRKSIYIPKAVNGEITNLYAAQKIGISIRSVTELKRRYKQGYNFVRTSKGHKPYNQKYDEVYVSHLLTLYHTNWEGVPYKTFWRGLRDFEGINIPYDSLRAILKRNNIKPFREYKTKEKPKHESRKERPCTGELLQLDASRHDWFMNGTYTTLHGAIDDATHIVTGLYFCDNECRLGYNEVLRQTFTNYGKPESVYIDRHSSFVTTPKGKKITLEERVQKEKSSDTHFTQLCRDLNIEIILALSAQGKGRIERLWGTLQGILPFYFRRLGISDNGKANEFLKGWLPSFNREFSIMARSDVSHFHRFYKADRLDYVLAIKETKKTDRYGCFVFHSHYFELVGLSKTHITFTLLLSEQFGLKGLYNGLYYDVRLCDDTLGATPGGKMPEVEQDLIRRYLHNDLRAMVV